LGALDVASERLMDTAIGSALAALGSYFIFPLWESSQLQNYMAGVLKANIHFLEKLRDLIAGKEIASLDYKLVRKEVFVSNANLAAALHRMQSEPKNKQRHKNQIYEFVVLNNLLSSNISSIASDILTHKVIPQIEPASLDTSIDCMKENLEKLENRSTSESDRKYQPHARTEQKDEGKAQLEFIRKLIADIDKLTNIIVDKKRQAGLVK
jgi:hypothetical protein